MMIAPMRRRALHPIAVAAILGGAVALLLGGMYLLLGVV